MSKVTVVTPTYNERDNIGMLAERIFQLGIRDLSLFVVDDNSTDGTKEILLQLSKKYPVYVLHRERKLGLGTAYIDAFRKVLQGDADIIVQMDADLSHDPSVIPTMLEKIQSYDMVLGSRYVRGGRIENWDRARKLVSKFGNFYARIILGLAYKDLTGGYKCFKRDVLEAIDLGQLSSIGYNFQIETTYEAHKNGFNICEIPITFSERKTGQSKFNIGIIFESFIKVLRLRWSK